MGTQAKDIAQCRFCEDTQLVCEEHPDRPWDNQNACGCGGAGMPCRCIAVRTVTIVLPEGYKDADEFAADCGFQLVSAQADPMDVAEAIYNAQVDHKPYPEVAKALLDRFIICPKSSGPHSRMRDAIDTVIATFEKDEAQGYRSKDRQFAIEILRKAIAP